MFVVVWNIVPFFRLGTWRIKCSWARRLWGFSWLKWGPVESFSEYVYNSLHVI
jgi:hypothetical protein